MCNFCRAFFKLISDRFNLFFVQEVITKETYLDILRQLVDITANAVSVTNVEDINFVAQIVNNVWRFVNEDDMVFIAVSHTKVQFCSRFF